MSSHTPLVVQIDHDLTPKPLANEIMAASPGPSPWSRAISPVGTFALPSVPAITATPPPSAALLTPPVERELRQEGNYFSPRPGGPQRSSSRLTRTTSPSDNLYTSTCLSPSTGSYHSSDLGHSTCSGSSSEYLTPPAFQIDKDNPPYISRRGSSGSLTMMKKLRRANTLPDDKEVLKKLKKRQKSQRKRQKSNRRTVKMYEHQNRSHWVLSGCQVVPTAPRGRKDMCEGVDGHHTKSKVLGIDTSGLISSTSRATGTPVVSARRWSSVEVGAHQIISELTASARPTASNEHSSPKLESISAVQSVGSRFRSSTFTRGAMDNDIVRTVRERLTLRKIPFTLQQKTPVSITLRRASEISSQSEASHAFSAVFKSAEPSGATTPLARLQDLQKHQQQESAAYLITSKDIDSITALIEENIRQQYEGRPGKKAGAETSSAVSESPTVTSKGVLVPHSHSDVALAVVEARNSSGQKQDDYLQVASGTTKHITIPRKPSQQSVHEVIWQGSSSPQRTSSMMEDDEQKQSSYYDCSPGTPREMDLRHGHNAQSIDSHKNVGGAFDPKHAHASINEWSMRCPQDNIAVVITSSDSESPDHEPNMVSGPFEQQRQMQKKAASMHVTRLAKEQPKKRAPPNPRPAVSDSNLKQSRAQLLLTPKDVISFPPLLSRKSTEEWYSPLPEITSTQPLEPSRSLYELGLDANSGPLSSSSKTVTPQASFTDLREEVHKSPCQVTSPCKSIKFNPAFDMRKQSVTRVDSLNTSISPVALGPSQRHVQRKSIVKDHPSAVPRVGDISKMGSAIGIHGHERRRSSAVPGTKVKRVRTIDNAHKGERDAPSSKWRRPSAFPSRKSSSPFSPERSGDTRSPLPSPLPSPADTSRKGGSGYFDRAALIKAGSPPQPKVDTVGIYAQLTGSRRANTIRDPCLLESGPCEPHDCEDCGKKPRNPSIDWMG